MNRLIEAYMKETDTERANALALENIANRVDDAISELTHLNEIRPEWCRVISGRVVSVSYTVRSKADLAMILATFARHDIRRDVAKHTYEDAIGMRRAFDLADGKVNIWISLAGENCRRVEVGTQPKYEIVCDEPAEV